MRCERIFKVEFDPAARERTIPTILVTNADADGEIVDVGDDSGQLLAGGQSDGGQDRLVVGIEHMRLKLNGIVFVRDAG